MSAFSGLTWDHPRGRAALEAGARDWAGSGLELTWDVHPLEGFESSPIEELAARYDLIVLDHPHLGDALQHGSLRPVDELFDADEIAVWAADSVGPSLESYRLARHLWALPLDAATQVSARRAELVPEAPGTWDEVLELSRRVPVALSIAGPHAFLSFCSIAVALGEEPDVAGADALLSREAGERVLALMVELASTSPDGTEELNPIAMLQAMTEGDTIAYCPLVYGYVNYSTPGSARSVSFGDAPAGRRSGRRGSTIGGTGIAVSARCDPSPELLAHIRWLMDRGTQRTFIPQHEGQPSARSAWTDPSVDAAAAGFYSGTLATIEESWVRPRFPGYVAFQGQASALLRDALADGDAAGDALERLDDLYRNHHRAARAEGSTRP
ncbi:MAG: integral rane protein [Naasia sp.]|jgi:multiple sugar transport system substrate-binding protein|uniref:ABC transporter substrate-binding protein n=1 Tax=Naasia sp. TaxID=2546198 RepID=UPI002603CEEB|nr:ABC transporter substrate-binding protein [Naasia sp.]MCU1571651.1 integral rane protein [Naasia sp.]